MKIFYLQLQKRNKRFLKLYVKTVCFLLFTPTLAINVAETCSWCYCYNVHCVDRSFVCFVCKQRGRITLKCISVNCLATDKHGKFHLKLQIRSTILIIQAAS